MEENEKQQQIKIQLDTKGFLKIEGIVTPESKEVIAQAFQQAEYYRLKASEDTKSYDEQTTMISLLFVLLIAFMGWSIFSRITNANTVKQTQTEINYVR